MKTSFILITIVLVSVIIFSLNACNKKKNDKKTSEISTDIKGILWLFNPPYQPKAVWWQTIKLGTSNTPSAPGPNDYKLTAVLLLDKTDVEEILKKSTLVQSQNLSVSDTFLNKSEVQNLLKDHGTLEDKIYDASYLLKNGGSMIRIKGTDKLFISYTTR